MLTLGCDYERTFESLIFETPDEIATRRSQTFITYSIVTRPRLWTKPLDQASTLSNRGHIVIHLVHGTTRHTSLRGIFGSAHDKICQVGTIIYCFDCRAQSKYNSILTILPSSCTC